MAGLTHSALRQIFSSFGGVGLLSTEMLRAKSLPTENPGVSPFLVRSAEEKPLSYQLLVFSGAEVAPAVDALHRFGADAIDLNMGCTKRSIGWSGGGFMLMEQPENARAIVREARKATNLPLTAKIRLGVRLDEQALRDFCRMIEDEGVDMLTVHARLKKDSFARPPKWDRVAGLKELLGIPVVVNGGIFTVEDARRCLAVSGADGLMLGRGAAIRPWLFNEIARDLFGYDIVSPVVSLPAIYNRFIGLMEESFRPERRLGRLKEFTHYFARNYRFGHLLTAAIQSSTTMDQARERTDTFFKTAGVSEDPG